MPDKNDNDSNRTRNCICIGNLKILIGNCQEKKKITVLLICVKDFNIVAIDECEWQLGICIEHELNSFLM